MRKALKKATDAQDTLRGRTPRSFRAAEPMALRWSPCLRCRHGMYFDELVLEDLRTVRCDRCRRPI